MWLPKFVGNWTNATISSALSTLVFPCNTSSVEGQYINIAEMTYHAACFTCTRCQKNLYGKQFAAVGGTFNSSCSPSPFHFSSFFSLLFFIYFSCLDPKTPTWKIYCNECDNLNASKSTSFQTNAVLPLLLIFTLC